MEGGRSAPPHGRLRFPRATRGWKYEGAGRSGWSCVSPALRGDGRQVPTHASIGYWFPPRYAGMEGEAFAGCLHEDRFPRATRGWKVDVDWVMGPILVSPALRGDGRESPRYATNAVSFPPCYAGMKGGECCIYPASAGMEGGGNNARLWGAGFPHISRGWKCGWSLM